MDYKPIKNAVNYFKEKTDNIVRTVADSVSLFGLEFALAGVSNKYNPPGNDIGYGGIAYFSKKDKVFDRTAGVYVGTKKRPHGLTIDDREAKKNHGIKWDSASDLEAKAKLILDAISLKKSDPRYKHTKQPSKSDINWARDYSRNHK